MRSRKPSSIASAVGCPPRHQAWRGMKRSKQPLQSDRRRHHGYTEFTTVVAVTATEVLRAAANCVRGSMGTPPEPNEPPAQRASAVWLLLSLFIGWGVGAAGFALI